MQLSPTMNFLLIPCRQSDLLGNPGGFAGNKHLNPRLLAAKEQSRNFYDELVIFFNNFFPPFFLLHLLCRFGFPVQVFGLNLSQSTWHSAGVLFVWLWHEPLSCSTEKPRLRGRPILSVYRKLPEALHCMKFGLLFFPPSLYTPVLQVLPGKAPPQHGKVFCVLIFFFYPPLSS